MERKDYFLFAAGFPFLDEQCAPLRKKYNPPPPDYGLQERTFPDSLWSDFHVVYENTFEWLKSRYPEESSRLETIPHKSPYNNPMYGLMARLIQQVEATTPSVYSKYSWDSSVGGRIDRICAALYNAYQECYQKRSIKDQAYAKAKAEAEARR